MQDLQSLAESLRRPSLLVRAARHGLLSYNRNRDLRRLMGEASAPPPAVAVRRLMDEEALHEMRRQTGDAAYSLTRHVDLMIALMGELRLLQAPGEGA